MSNSNETNQEEYVQGHVHEHGNLIKTPKQLVVTVALSLIIPIVVILLLVSWVTTGTKTSAGSDTLGAEATTLRIAPLARIEITEGGAPVGAMVVATAPVMVAMAEPQSGPVTDGPADMVKGEQIYNQACMSCHAVGVANAPKSGDKAAWGPALATGMDSMVANAIKGKGIMPARGGLASASDKDISDAVHYMVGQLK